MGAAQRAKQATRTLLAGLWEKNLPVQRERLLQLEAATKAAREGVLSTDDRKAAGSTAHKLAGSLGMFGYPQGTDLARELEQMLDHESALDAKSFSERVAALRAELGL